MRGPTLLLSMLALSLAVPAAAPAQTKTEAPNAGQARTKTEAPTAGQARTYHGGATARESARRVLAPGKKAVRMRNGFAAAPAAAPARVQRAVWATNRIVGKPYRWGGGHRSFKASGYDCSGTVSFALNAAGALTRPLASGALMSWGRPSKGRWITVYTHHNHAYTVVAGLRLDTSSAGERRSSGSGPRWRKTHRSSRGFVARHPKGL